jgi:anti-sigma regulatory factor (Ser/Thr protein kinase)
VSIGPETILLEVEDAGAAFDPASAPLPRRADSLANAVPGGWGIGLIRRFCPSLTYERRDGVNRLTMPFARAERSYMVGFSEPTSPR